MQAVSGPANQFLLVTSILMIVTSVLNLIQTVRTGFNFAEAGYTNYLYASMVLSAASVIAGSLGLVFSVKSSHYRLLIGIGIALAAVSLVVVVAWAMAWGIGDFSIGACVLPVLFLTAATAQQH
jgi:hypothetical protein